VGVGEPGDTPAFVLTDGVAELWVGANRRAVVAWPQIHQIAVEVVIDDEDYVYSEMFWQIAGPGPVFRAPVGLATGAERFEARLLRIPGFDAITYQRGQESAACFQPGLFVCWSRQGDRAEPDAGATRGR
jgi:hypothetical protein